MQIGVPKETAELERRVGLVPETVKKLTEAGHSVRIERGAGEGALIPDEAFSEAGAELVDASGAWGAEVVVKVAPPSAEEAGKLGSEQTLVSFLQPLTDKEGVERLESAGVTAFALESVPRISRAQSMDALSSQANVGGYRAALLGAQELGRYLPMLMTAAGTIRPATVLVLGAGVAGLQAIATARRLGAVVQAFDVRAAVKEQVESLGAKFLEFELGGDLEGEGGYAKELTEEQQAEQQKQLSEAIGKVDIVITTALVPGRPAPKLVTAEAVQGMKPGSVIVDLAGEAGGNCELSQPGETVIEHGVKILAPLNLPSTLAEHASQLYARNIQSLLELMTGEDGRLSLDWSDDIIKGACVAGRQDPDPEPAAATTAAEEG